MKLLTNAKIWHSGAFTEGALLIEGSKIAAIISPSDTRKLDAEVHDLQGSYVYPGFIDTHTHSFEGGLYSLGVDLSTVKSIFEALEKLDAAYQQASKHDIIFAWQFDETEIAEQRFPSLAELDKLIPDRALVLRRIDGHSCILNSFARKLLPALPSKDEIYRGGDNDLAVHFFHKSLSEELILAAYQRASQIAIQGGFTGIHTMVGDADRSISHYALIKNHLSSFPVNYTLYPQSFNLKAALETGSPRIGGCILADGSIGSETAALSSPYLGKPNSGELCHPDSFWREFIGKAHQHKLQVAIHCIGDAAISQINNIYKELQDSDPQDLRHQLIHCELTPDRLIEEIAQSHAVPVMQPNFDLLWGGDQGFYTRKLGLERSRQMNRFASFAQHGIKITGGSDWYITALDAVMSIRAAMNHHNPAERLAHSQSVDIYTRNAAWLSHEEDCKGQLKAGFDADLSVLSHALNDATISPIIKRVYTRGELRYHA